jgi:hypothetical protein
MALWDMLCIYWNYSLRLCRKTWSRQTSLFPLSLAQQAYLSHSSGQFVGPQLWYSWRRRNGNIVPWVRHKRLNQLMHTITQQNAPYLSIHQGSTDQYHTVSDPASKMRNIIYFWVLDVGSLRHKNIWQSVFVLKIRHHSYVICCSVCNYLYKLYVTRTEVIQRIMIHKGDLHFIFEERSLGFLKWMYL